MILYSSEKGNSSLFIYLFVPDVWQIMAKLIIIKVAETDT